MPEEPSPDVLPSLPRRRRAALIAGAVLATLVIAVAVVVAVRLTSQRQEFASPGDPCALVSGTTLAKYVPGGGIGTANRYPSTSTAGAPRLADCNWYGTAEGLSVEVGVYGSDSGPAGAQQGFGQDVQYEGKNEQLVQGTKILVTGTRTVTGLGDQAEAIFQTLTLTSGPSYSVNLLVRSGNATIDVSYDSFAKPAGTAQLTAVIVIARDVLASLARPARTSSTSPGPLYASLLDPCPAIPPATVAEYLTGGQGGTPTPSPSMSQPGSCSWTTLDGARSLLADVTIYDSATASNGAQQGFNADVRHNQGAAVSGQQPVTGLGTQATALFELRGTPHVVMLLVRSGNAEIQLTYTCYLDPSGPPLPTGPAQLAATIAMARDILAALPRS